MTQQEEVTGTVMDTPAEEPCIPPTIVLPLSPPRIVRPQGVTEVAIMMFLLAGASLLSTGTAFFRVITHGGWFTNPLLTAFGLLLIIASLIIGYSLLELRPWARLAGVILCIIKFVTCFYHVYEGICKLPDSSGIGKFVAWNFIYGICYIAMLIILLTPTAGRAFRRESPLS